ncbi:glycerophosphodiester phosphodiesterase family protein [Hymenobacter bucti]|uniref:Glycerophosphodiester phosphodiesterase family protein n=1 Tax=Hymenobacter bucti TaxID=1844114 RepID=A0ABW4QPB1_9BACT
MNDSFPPQPHRPEVHGHRGCRGLRPENTLPAFLHAVALGADVLELDVVISQDHQVVVSHEPWLSAKLGRDALGQLIDPAQEQQYNLYQLPYAAIRRCAVGEWPHPDFPEQQPIPSYRPLLCDMLRQAAAASQLQGRSIGFSVEIKSSPEGDDVFHPRPAQFVDLVMAELQTAEAIDRTTLLSFDPRVLQAARHSYPGLALCLLIEDHLPPVAELFGALGFEPEVLGPDFHLLSAATVQGIRAEYPELRLAPWTVNTPAELALVLSWQTDAITTDYPDRLLSLLGKA